MGLINNSHAINFKNNLQCAIVFSFIPGSEYVLRLLRMILALRTIRR